MKHKDDTNLMLILAATLGMALFLLGFGWILAVPTPVNAFGVLFMALGSFMIADGLDWWRYFKKEDDDDS